MLKIPRQGYNSSECVYVAQVRLTRSIGITSLCGEEGSFPLSPVTCVRFLSHIESSFIRVLYLRRGKRDSVTKHSPRIQRAAGVLSPVRDKKLR